MRPVSNVIVPPPLFALRSTLVTADVLDCVDGVGSECEQAHANKSNRRVDLM
jgi:hypothetical protein